eukprot:g48485.t1
MLFLKHELVLDIMRFHQHTEEYMSTSHDRLAGFARSMCNVILIQDNAPNHPPTIGEHSVEVEAGDEVEVQDAASRVLSTSVLSCIRRETEKQLELLE